jgi:vacuole morphology and inheritance protein 14
LQTYERRKLAALEVETLIQNLAKHDQFARIYLIVDTLATTYASPSSGNANARKGGCLCLAAVAVALAGHPESQSPEFISKVTPPVLIACTDADSRVRYYALEALYNISKSTRPAILAVFPEKIFDVLFRLCSDPDRSVQNAASILDELMKTSIGTDAPNFPLDAFLTKLVDCMAVDSSPQRLFLLGWISLVDGLPRADVRLLRALPQLLPGMLDFLADPAPEVQSAASKLLHQLMMDTEEDPGRVDVTALCMALTDWLAENEPPPPTDSSASLGDLQLGDHHHNTDYSIAKNSMEAARGVAIAWLRALVAAAPAGLGNQAAALIKTSLRCLDTSTPEMQALGNELNEELLHADSLLDKADISELLSTAAQGIGAIQESARLAALRWTALLLQRHSTSTSVNKTNGEGGSSSGSQLMISSSDMLEPTVLPALCDALSSNSDRVVHEAVAVLAAVSGSGEEGCRRALASVLGCFRGAPGAKLLQRRGSAIVERLCQRMGAQRVLSTLANLISEESENEVDFSRLMAQAVSLMLLTSPELEEARAMLSGGGLSQSIKTNNKYKSNKGSTTTNYRSNTEFFKSLFPGLSCCVTAALSVSFLAGAYPLAADIIVKLTEQPLIADMSASVVELGQVVSLLEAPVFAGLRLQLLSPHHYPGLLRALHSLLLVLPQGEAFRMLKQRLECIPTMDIHRNVASRSTREEIDSPGAPFEGDESHFDTLLAIFVDVQTRKVASSNSNNNSS